VAGLYLAALLLPGTRAAFLDARAAGNHSAWLINAWRVAGRRCRQAGVGIAGIQGWSVSASRNAVILSMPCLAAVET